MPIKKIGYLLVAAGSLVLGACGGGGGSGITPASSASSSPTLASITVSAAQPLLTSGQSEQMTATGHYSDGSTQNISSAVVWSSNNAAAATISSAGVLHGVAAGSTTISAQSGIIVGTDALTVAPIPVLTSITVSAAQPVLTSGQSEQMMATGHYSDGSTQNISSAVVWSSSNTAAATISSAGVLHGVTSGIATIIAQSGVIVGADALTIDASWSAVGNLTDARAAQGAALLPSGQVLVIGGYQGSGSGAFALGTAELYDPASKTWSMAANVPGACSGGSATTLPNGKVLSVCGLTVYIYTPATNSWSGPTVAPHYYRWGSATLLLNGKVLLIGAQGFANADLYNPATNTWASAGVLPVALSNYTTTLLANGNVLVVGGNTPTGTYSIPVSQSMVELYNATTNTWSAAATLATPRSSHSATLLASGQVLVAGGLNLQLGASSSSQTSTKLASAELYNPATNSWSAAANLTTTRYGHGSVTLTDGRAMVIAGGTPTSAKNAEIYDPVTNIWSVSGTLGTLHKYQSTSTLLQDGSVLVVGGSDGTGPVAGTDLYR
jgi:N-acetylneuraminic acid mutarotase